MNDIISRAQELVELRASMDKSSIREVLTRETEENMFAQTLIEALATEEWEYGVQSCEYSESAKMWSGWGHFAIPFEKQRTRESCEQFIKGRLDPRFEYRLVRRRISLLEVVNG